MPFYVRAGKCLKENSTEVIVDMKSAPPVVFHEPQPDNGNYVRFRLSPTVAIGIGARAKKPGEGMEGEHIELSVVEAPQQGSGGRLEAYERLLGDAMRGDATLFARQDVVEAAWSIVDPVLQQTINPETYDCESWGPAGAIALADPVGGWRCG